MATEQRSAMPSSANLKSAGTLAPNPPLPPRAQRALTYGLLLSGLRCTVQYVVLPFVLPWIGVTTTVPPWITVVLSALALAALIRNLRSLWRLRHPRRWNYLVLAAGVIASLLVFTAVDLHTLLRV